MQCEPPAGCSVVCPSSSSYVDLSDPYIYAASSQRDNDGEYTQGSASASVSAARVLQDTCNYIRSLHQEVDNLSETLAELLASADVTSEQAAVIRSLLLM